MSELTMASPNWVLVIRLRMLLNSSVPGIMWGVFENTSVDFLVLATSSQ